MLNHVLKIASFSRLAVNVGNDVADFHSCHMCRSSRNYLSHNYLAAGLGNSVYTYASEIIGGVDCNDG